MPNIFCAPGFTITILRTDERIDEFLHAFVAFRSQTASEEDRRRPMQQDQSLRNHLIELLDGAQAHATFDQVIGDFPAKLRGEIPRGLPHSAWMLLEHVRIAQWDILDFSRNPNYAQLKWPKDYWPKTPAPPNEPAWEKSVQAFRGDLDAMKELVNDPTTDLFAKIPWGDGQTVLREVMLVADHNSHHVGQLIDLRRLLGIWK
jgi:DinB superfamily